MRLWDLAPWGLYLHGEHGHNVEGVRVRNRGRAAAREAPDVYTVTDARRPLSEDIQIRERRYLITMGIRIICFVLTIVLAAALHGPLRWLAVVALAGAVGLPYIAVILANGGREPESAARFEPYDPIPPERKGISGPNGEIGS